MVPLLKRLAYSVIKPCGASYYLARRPGVVGGFFALPNDNETPIPGESGGTSGCSPIEQRGVNSVATAGVTSGDQTAADDVHLQNVPDKLRKY
jgi:hypothetical protein